MSLNKWERIQAVKILGLNTEESILVKDAELNREQNAFIKKYKVFSLRTFSKDDNVPHPHYPVITQQKLLEQLLLLTEADYSCIVAKCINPAYAELVGCAYKRGRSVTFEIAYGAGTVRRVTHEGKIDKSFTTGVFQRTGDWRLDCVLKELRGTPVDECIFEFSWYKTLVGHKKQHMIFWEVTGASEKGIIATENGGILKI